LYEYATALHYLPRHKCCTTNVVSTAGFLNGTDAGVTIKTKEPKKRVETQALAVAAPTSLDHDGAIAKVFAKFLSKASIEKSRWCLLYRRAHIDVYV